MILPRGSSGSSGSLSEEPRGEIIQASPPRQPFMGRAGRLEVDVVDSSFRQRVAEILRPLSFGGADAQEQHLHLLVERGWIRERPAAGGFRVEAPAPAAAARSEEHTSELQSPM